MLVSVFLVGQIADHHDAHPTDYKEFKGNDGRVLATRAGGKVSELRGKPLSLTSRVSDVVAVLECSGTAGEAKLIIGDGTYYVIVYVK